MARFRGQVAALLVSGAQLERGDQLAVAFQFQCGPP
jgi:hypothetical protein